MRELGHFGVSHYILQHFKHLPNLGFTSLLVNKYDVINKHLPTFVKLLLKN